MNSIKGLGTALVTPFKNGQVDFDALSNLIEYQIEGGIDFLVTMGTTGESVTLSKSEKKEVVQFTIQQTRNRVPVVMGLGGNNTAEVARQMHDADWTGIEAVLSASPAYNKPSQQGILQHYTALTEACNRPIIVYNVPGRTASNITAHTTLALAQLDGICGIKEASGDLTQGAQIADGMPDDFVLLSGDDPTAFHLTALGGHGCISVLSNLAPADFRKAVVYSSWDEHAEARRQHLRFLPLHPWLYIDGNPAGIKAALHARGLCQNELRLPLTPMQSDHQQSLVQMMDDINL